MSKKNICKKIICICLLVLSFTNFYSMFNVKKQLDLSKSSLETLLIESSMENIFFREMFSFLNFFQYTSYIGGYMYISPTGIYIDKGKKKGIQKGDVVANQFSIIGLIENVKEDFSKVILLDDPLCSVEVLISRLNMKMVMKGLRIRHFKNHDNVEVGDVVYLTNNKSSSNGLPIGRISIIKEDQIMVNLFQSKFWINNVFVINSKN